MDKVQFASSLAFVSGLVGKQKRPKDTRGWMKNYNLCVYVSGRKVGKKTVGDFLLLTCQENTEQEDFSLFLLMRVMESFIAKGVEIRKLNYFAL
jgi:hypothetical protein